MPFKFPVLIFFRARSNYHFMLLITVSNVALTLEKAINCNMVSVHTNKCMPHASKLPAWRTVYLSVVTCTQLWNGQGYMYDDITRYSDIYIHQLLNFGTISVAVSVSYNVNTSYASNYLYWWFRVYLIINEPSGHWWEPGKHSLNIFTNPLHPLSLHA